MRTISIMVALGVFLSPACAAKVAFLSWTTQHASEPIKLIDGQDQFLPAFRAALRALPESAVVALVLSQASLLGLSPVQAAELQPLVAERYRQVATSPAYASAPSLLPYCFSAVKPVKGMASIYIPNEVTAASPVIVFLHGYGGSFLWYLHWLSESFPDAVILCPAFGVSPATMPPAYVQESLNMAEREIGFPLRRPILLGLSSGGFGACRVYVATPDVYSGITCLGAYPPSESLRSFPKHGQAHFLAGSRETFVTSLLLQRSVQFVRNYCPRTTIELIPDGDHFFMLTHPKLTVDALRRSLHIGGK